MLRCADSLTNNAREISRTCIYCPRRSAGKTRRAQTRIPTVSEMRGKIARVIRLSTALAVGRHHHAKTTSLRCVRKSHNSS